MVPKSVWPKRYELINDFEKMLHDNGTRIVKFYLHISSEEQLERFQQRLDDAMRHWKISEGNYSERKLWPDYMEAYEEAGGHGKNQHRARTLVRRRWTSRKFVTNITLRQRGRRCETTSRRRSRLRSNLGFPFSQ
jgi:polyphosphate kinase 2 (PPK2 family)